MSEKSTPKPSLFLYIPLMVLLLAGTLLRAEGLRHVDATRLSGSPLFDDAFYYFSLGRNLAQHADPRIDALHNTTGFQPLWGFLVALPYLVGGESGGLTGVLILGIVVGVLSCAIIYALTWRVTGSVVAAALNAGAFFLSPQAVVYNLSGMETSLAALALLLILWSLYRLYEAKSRRWLVICGVACGVGCLARIDIGIWVILIGAALLFYSPFRAAWRERLRGVVMWGAALLITLLPWVIFSAALGKSPIPESGRAVRTQVAYISDEAVRPPELTWTTLTGENPTFGADYNYFGRNALWFTREISDQFYLLRPLIWREVDIHADMVGVLDKIVVFALILWLAAGAASLFTPSATLRLVWLIVSLSAVALVVAYTFVIYITWFYTRYAMPLSVVLEVVGLLCICKWGLSRRREVRRVFMGLMGAGGLVLGLAYADAYRHDAAYTWITHQEPVLSDGFYPAAQWLNSHAGAEDRIGALQSGLIGYYTTAPVINLDGKVNHAAQTALAEGQMWQYVCDMDIRYVVDWPVWVYYLLITRSENWQDDNLLPVAEFPNGWINPVQIYEVNRANCANVTSNVTKITNAADK